MKPKSKKEHDKKADKLYKMAYKEGYFDAIAYIEGVVIADIITQLNREKFDKFKAECPDVPILPDFQLYNDEGIVRELYDRLDAMFEDYDKIKRAGR